VLHLAFRGVWNRLLLEDELMAQRAQLILHLSQIEDQILDI